MRGAQKSLALGILAQGPADTFSIAAAIGRTMKQANAFMCWMARRGYVRRAEAGRAGRINSKPSVWVLA